MERYFRVEENVPMYYMDGLGNTVYYDRYECRYYTADNLPDGFDSLPDKDKAKTLWDLGNVTWFYDEWDEDCDIDGQYEHEADKSREMTVISITELADDGAVLA